MNETTATLPNRNAGEVLRAAAQRVRGGWAQGTVINRGGGVCALGAVRVGFGMDARQTGGEFPTVVRDAKRAVAKHVIRALVVAIGQTYKGYKADDATAITSWNDAEGQTAENVAQGLEYAALLWEQEQAQQAMEPSTSGEIQAAPPLVSSR